MHNEGLNERIEVVDGDKLLVDEVNGKLQIPPPFEGR